MHIADPSATLRTCLRVLYEYNCWMNERILETAARVTPAQFAAPRPEGTRLTPRNLQDNLVHILDVEWSWRERARGASQEVWEVELAVEDFPDVASLASRWREESAIMREYLAGLNDEDLERPFQLGEDRQVPLWQILLHAINHGTLARVEAAVLLTHYGHSPGDLDFLDYADPRP
jgi:uncharacterized damage-inducible protein DinB